MIVLTPASASASISAVSSFPVTLIPGARGEAGGCGMSGSSDGLPEPRRLRGLPSSEKSPDRRTALRRRAVRRRTAPVAAPGRRRESRTARAGAAWSIARVEVLAGHRGLRQHLDVPAVHRAQPVAQRCAPCRSAAHGSSGGRAPSAPAPDSRSRPSS